MTVTYAPAPWTICEFVTGSRAIHDAKQRVVALVVPMSANDSRPAANARLIAAAPELLCELTALLPAAAALGIDTDTARAVVRRAIGEEA